MAFLWRNPSFVFGPDLKTNELKKTISSILFFALYGIVTGQNSTSVRLTDAENTSGIPYAHVLNKTSGAMTTSNENGVFSISGNPTDSIRISSLGYKIKVYALNQLQSNKSAQLNPSQEYLKEISVVADEIKNIGTQRIDKIGLKLIPINNSQDLLKTVGGLFIAQHAGGGKAEQIFLRGFDNDHGTDFAAYIDDIPVNLPSHAHGQGYADMHFVIPELIEDAEYYKGPYEAKNGNFAVSGAARYKTKSGLTENSIKLDFGQYGYQRGLMLLNLTPNNRLISKNKTERAYLALEGTFNDSYFESPQNFEKYSGLFKYNTQLNDRTALSVMSAYFKSHWKASGQIPLRAVNSGDLGWFGAIDDNEGGNTSRLNTSLKLTSFLNNNQQISNNIYFVHNEYALYSNFTFFLNDSVNGDMIEQLENRNIFGYTFAYDRKDKVGNTSWAGTFSAGVRSDWVNLALNTTALRTVTEEINKSIVNEVNYWAYAKENIKLNPQFNLQLGMRLDYFTFKLNDKIDHANSGIREAVRISPKASLFYNPTENVQLFAKAGSGYHSNYTHAAVTDRDIHPLPKALSADLGTEFKIGDKFISTVALWTIKSDAEYIFVADAGEFENNGSALRRGIDISAKYSPTKNLWFNLSTNYSKGTLLDEPDDANSIPSAPRLTSTASLIYKYKKNLDLYLGTRYMAERPLNEDESVMAESYFLTDATIQYTLNKIQLGFSVQNIFNNKWKEAVFYDASRLQNEVNPVDDIHFTPGTPRFVKVSVRYNF